MTICKNKALSMVREEVGKWEFPYLTFEARSDSSTWTIVIDAKRGDAVVWKYHIATELAELAADVELSYVIREALRSAVVGWALSHLRKVGLQS